MRRLSTLLLAFFCMTTAVFIAAVSEEETPMEQSNSVFRVDIHAIEPVHQVGEQLVLNSFNDAYGFHVAYPHVGGDADAKLRAWTEEQISTLVSAYDGGGADERGMGELNIGYSAWRAGKRYAGVLEFGWMDNPLEAHPREMLFGVNVDLATGKTFSGIEIFRPERLADMAATLRAQALPFEMLNEDDNEVDESWLQSTVLTDNGIVIPLRKGEFFPSYAGTLMVSVPYGLIKDFLAVDLDMPMPETQVVKEPEQALPFAPQTDIPRERAIDPSKPMLALTFDDGPSEFTMEIAKALENAGGRGTFFMIGRGMAEHPEIVAEVSERGHQIGCHTWSHPNLTKITDGKIDWQVRHTQELAVKLTGKQTTMLRPPYGAYNSNVSAVLRRHKMPIIMWSVDTKDWATRNASQTYHAIINGAGNGKIILCHDLYQETANAVFRAIPELVRQGYQLVTVEEMMSFRNKPLKPGVAYSHLDPKKIVTE